MPTHSPCVAHTHTHNTAQTHKHTNPRVLLILLPKLKELRGLMRTHEHARTPRRAAKHSKVLNYISSVAFETASWDVSTSYMSGCKIMNTNMPCHLWIVIIWWYQGRKSDWKKSKQMHKHEVTVFSCTCGFIDILRTNMHRKGSHAWHRGLIDLVTYRKVKLNTKFTMENFFRQHFEKNLLSSKLLRFRYSLRNSQT